MVMSGDGAGPMIRALLADDEDLIRAGLAALLGLEPDIEVVAEAFDGRGALTAARAHRPDVAVIDLQMPALNGMEVCAELARVLPGCKAVILTGHGRPPHLHRALTAGAKGFLPKGAPGGTLAEVIRRVHGGGRYVDPALAADALTAPECPLTPRELDVLRLAELATPVSEVSRRTNLSIGSVRNHLSAAVSKLKVANRAEAFRTARDNGWL